MPKPPFRHDALTRPGPFRKALRDWFTREGKDHPWRRTRDPYAILVSEVMLQQTQIATVLDRGFYTRFLERFPDTATLAGASDDALLKAWEGLGYYRRARMLREAARRIEAGHGGRFPDDFDAILALPGVGRYTAGAVLSFAFDRPAPLVDGNVLRVFSRLFDFRGDIARGASQKQCWSWAGDLLDGQRPRIHNSALMELGQTICRPGKPDCTPCPVARFCRCRDPEALPVKSAAKPPEQVDEHVVLARRGDRVLLRKLGEGRRAGMWRLPEREPSDVADLPVVHRRKYGITRYRVTLHVHAAATIRKAAGESWQPLDALETLVIPPADRAALEAVLADAEENP